MYPNLHDVPNLLDGIEVRGVGWPGHDRIMVFIEPIHYHIASMHLGIILHEDLIQMLVKHSREMFFVCIEYNFRRNAFLAHPCWIWPQRSKV